MASRPSVAAGELLQDLLEDWQSVAAPLAVPG
jgi:hypothetical protein